jgi:SAM-dependent methyltransferase
MKIYWNAFAYTYRNLAPPLKPSAEDVTAAEDTLARWRTEHARVDLNALLCGVTPALAEMKLPLGTQLEAVEQSEPMIRAIWPGDTATRRAIRGNWLDLPNADHSVDIILGDGCFNCMEYPVGYRALFTSLQRVLASDGIVLMRFFVRPEQREDLESVFSDLHAARIPSFHIFKWRLAMALQESTAAGIVVNEIHAAWAARHIRTSDLASKLGWSEVTIKTIDAYKGKETRFSFPSVDEVRAVLPDSLSEILVRVPSYPLGERCPTFVLKPR